jgi:regulatory protein
VQQHQQPWPEGKTRLFVFMEATITSIKQQKRNPQRVNIYLDGNYAFPLSKIVAAWLKVGQKLRQEEILKLQFKEEIEVAFQKAVNFISYRPRSQSEVERNLKKNEVAEALFPEIIERLKRSNLLNDADFARQWVENRSVFRPRGAHALRAELRQKGLSDELIEQSISGLDEEGLARAAAQKKLRQLRNLEWPEFRNKLSSYLSRRGFGFETAASICQEQWNEIKQTNRQESVKG